MRQPGRHGTRSSGKRCCQRCLTPSPLVLQFLLPCLHFLQIQLQPRQLHFLLDDESRNRAAAEAAANDGDDVSLNRKSRQTGDVEVEVVDTASVGDVLLGQNYLEVETEERGAHPPLTEAAWRQPVFQRSRIQGLQPSTRTVTDGRWAEGTAVAADLEQLGVHLRY